MVCGWEQKQWGPKQGWAGFMGDPSLVRYSTHRQAPWPENLALSEPLAFRPTSSKQQKSTNTYSPTQLSCLIYYGT